MKKQGSNRISHFAKVNENTVLEGNNYIGRWSSTKNTKIGFASYIGSKTKLNNVKIGRYCSIGSNISIIDGKHPTDTFASTHPAFYAVNNASQLKYVTKNKFQEFSFTDENGTVVEIGNDVWVGNDVRIIGGVKIGDGAVIGSCALVTKDVEPYSIVGGVPAKVIKKRFSDDIISKLLETKWWNKDAEWISSNAEIFDNVEKLLEELEK